MDTVMAEWMAFEEARQKEEHARWAADRLADDPEADVSEEAWADELVGIEEANSDDLAWKNGCR
jgi:hypothetical protein